MKRWHIWHEMAKKAALNRGEEDRLVHNRSLAKKSKDSKHEFRCHVFGGRMARLLILFLAFTQGTSEIPRLAIAPLYAIS